MSAKSLLIDKCGLEVVFVKLIEQLKQRGKVGVGLGQNLDHGHRDKLFIQVIEYE